jgi:hypothetical protein
LIPHFFARMRRLRIAEGRPRRGRGASVIFPLNFNGRTLVFDGGFDDLDRVCSVAPEALAAPLTSAMDLADVKLSGVIDLPSLSFAVVVLTDASTGPLENYHRDHLWRAFHVPVFEQFQDDEGNVVARECETHCGLHVVAGTNLRVERGELWIGRHRTGLFASLCAEQCECGEETPRLRDLAHRSAAKNAAA